MATTFTVEIDWDHNGTWTDETARTRHIQIRTGFERPSDLVASVGRCILTLDNEDRRFSPGQESGPLYGKLLPRREVRVSAASGASTWVIFRGFIESITPQAGSGKYGVCEIECVDGIALLARQQVGMSYATSRAVDDAVNDVVSAAYTPPAASYGDNGEVLEHYGRGWNPEDTSCLEALRQICEAVYGRFLITRDGTPIYLTRQSRQDPSVSAVLTVSSTSPLDDLTVALDIQSVINQVRVTVYPVETIGAAQVLWKARSTLRLAPGETRVIYALFRDSYGRRCGAVNVVTPAAYTDYTVNERHDGSGYDYTGSVSFTISTQTEATRMRITLTNSAIGALYVTLLQVRGQPILVYDPITIESEDAASQSAYQVRSLVLNLSMQPDEVFGESYANYLIGRFKSPALAADRLVVRDRDAMNGVNLFSIDLLDKIVISEMEAGADSLAHWVRAVEYDLTPAHTCVIFHLERADAVQYWLLGTAAYGELETKTRLGL